MRQETISHVEDITSHDLDVFQPTSLHGKRSEDADDAALRAQGHEVAMERQFNWISALGLAFSITNSWIGYLVSTHVGETRSKCLQSTEELLRTESEILRPTVLYFWADCCFLGPMDRYCGLK